MTRFAIFLLRPVEAYWAWSVRRSYRKGKFKAPAATGIKYSTDRGSPCVTTRREKAA